MLHALFLLQLDLALSGFERASRSQASLECHVLDLCGQNEKIAHCAWVCTVTYSPVAHTADGAQQMTYIKQVNGITGLRLVPVCSIFICVRQVEAALEQTTNVTDPLHVRSK